MNSIQGILLGYWKFDTADTQSLLQAGPKSQMADFLLCLLLPQYIALHCAGQET
jgi:hypothetical protein